MSDISSFQALRERLGGRNLYLVGMMGSGKSLTGPSLALALSYGFVDVDSVIEQLLGRSISQVFAEDGEASFRDVETQVLSSIGQRHSLIVATGGGVVVRSQNWGVLHQGIVIWLDPGIERLWARLQADPGNRPLLQSENPLQTFSELHAARKSFYAEADLHVVVNDEAPEEVAQRILEDLPSILSSPEDLYGPQTIAN